MYKDVIDVPVPVKKMGKEEVAPSENFLLKPF